MANVIKGLTVEIGGDTTKLGKALEKVNAKSKSLSSELGSINKLLKLDPGNTELLAQKQKVLAEAVANTKEKLSTLKEAERQVQEQFERGEASEEQLRALQREIIATTSKLNSYEKAANETQEQIDHLGDESENTGDETNELGDEMKKAKKHAKDFGEGMDDAGKETKSAGEKIESVAQIFKKVGKAVAIGLAAMGTGAVAAGKKIFDLTKETAAAGDVIDKQSQKMQISAEDYQRLSYAAELSGTNINVLQKAQKSLLSTGSDLPLVDALKQCADSSDVAGTAVEMFGAKTAQELLPMLNQGSDGIEKMLNQADNLGLVMSNDAVKASAQFSDSLSTLKDTFSATKNRIVSDFLPGVTMIMDGLTGLMTGADDAGAKIQEGAQQIVTAIEQQGPQIANVLMMLVNAVATVAPSLIQSLVMGIANNLPQLVISATQIVLTLVQAIVAAAPQIVSSALSLVTTLATGILENLPAIVDAALSIVETLILGLAEYIPNLIPTVVDCVILIATTLIDHIDELIMAAFTLIEALGKGIIDALPGLVAKLPTLINKIVNFITNNLPQLLAMGIKLVVELAVGLIKAIPQLVKQLPAILKAILDFMTSWPKSLLKVGENLVEGLWNGLKNSVSWLKDKIKGWVGDVMSFIKKLFGINSPSKETEWMGKMLDEGYAVGIEKNAKAPLNAMSDLKDDLMSEADKQNGLTIERRLNNTFGTTTELTFAESGILGKLEGILTAINAGKVLVLDGDKLVGGTLGRINSGLGEQLAFAERGAL